MTDLYRLVYTSRNLLEGSESEVASTIAEILAASQRNNRKVGVTGALLFNGGCFAQVLEGPRKGVEATFERIQRDPRHSDVSVLQCEPVEARGFTKWSMAFVGHSVRGRALWSELAAQTGFDVSRSDADQLFATLHAIVLEEERSGFVIAPPQPAEAERTPARHDPVPRRAEPLDRARLEAELFEARPAAMSNAVSSPDDVEAGEPEADAAPGRAEAVLRAALAEERARTTDLRRCLDEARIALAVAADQVDTLRRHRDHWAGRARALAAALCQEPDGAGSAAPAARQARPPGGPRAVA